MPKAIETIVSAKEKRRYSLRAQAEDLAEARKALESAANISRGLWFTFMSLAAGVFITTGTVTHRDLFLETPVKLPLLNAELPMVAFFWVAPLMFILFHSYLLLNLTSLGDNVRHYFDLVDDTGLDPKSKNKLYLQLPNFMVVQMLRARREKYWTTMGYALHVVVALTVVVGPLVALLFLQVKFLPFHSHIVTWVQRAVIAVDAVAIFYFWPQIVGKPASLLVWYVRLLLYAIVSFVFLFSFFVAQFPGESNYGKGPFESSGIGKRLFRGEVNDVTGEPRSFFSDRLVLANEDFIDLDDEKLSKADKTVSVRGRDLVGAYLARADLRKVDFTGTNMTGADFRGARLQGAIFVKPDRRPSDTTDNDSLKTVLRGVNFYASCLNGTRFNAADMKRARLNYAILDDAILTNAELQGATFDYAALVGANLNYAHLQGASLILSDLSKAKLFGSDLTGAAIFQSQLRGANLNLAKLHAVTFVGNNVLGLSDAGAKWRTTLVEGLKDDKPNSVAAKETPCKAIGSADPDTSKTPPAPSPPSELQRVRAIMSVGVKRFPENPSLNDSERWSERVDALIAAICDEKNAGTEVLHGIVDGPNFARKPDMHLWPFKRRIAEVVLYKHLTVEKTLHPMSCAETAVLPSALKGALKCWLDLDVVKGQTCMDTALKDEYFKSILP